MQYAAFLRGINVGGRNIAKMADVKQLFLEMGLTQVRTYIQSGNVLFAAQEQPDPNVIQDAFAQRFGVISTVILRSYEEVRNIVLHAPFPPELTEQAVRECPDVEHLYVYLSQSPIDSSRMERFLISYEGRDQLYLHSCEAYLLCFGSIRDSKLAAALSKTALSLTARNMNVMSKILEMMEA